MSNIGIISLGCAKNQVDTERMLGYLSAAGHSFVSDPSEAEILIVNTCGFIEPAKQESINTILEMAAYKTNAQCKKLVVTGCLSQRYREELRKALPEVDLFLGVHEYEKLPGLLNSNLPTVSPYAGRILTTPPYSAYLQIGDGCNNKCTYCAIPIIRGELQSTPMELLIDEAQKLADNGVTELTVIAQDTSGYGRDLYGEPKLMSLLDKLSGIDALHWIRVLYTYPDTVSPELLDLFYSNKKIVNYLDIPLQHISDRVLQNMNRRGSKAHIERFLHHLDPVRREFTLRTTMMVGFPGETDEDFEELLQFVRAYPFDRLGAFAFSPEDGTKAAEMPCQISEEIKQERLDRLMQLQQSISKSLNNQRIGKQTEVLIEGCDEEGIYGRSPSEAPDVDGVIRLPYKKGLKAGNYVSVRLTEAEEYDMRGVYIESGK